MSLSSKYEIKPLFGSNFPWQSNEIISPLIVEKKVERKLEEIKKQAYESGFKKGFYEGREKGEMAGLEEAKRKMEPLIKKLNMIMDEVSKLRKHKILDAKRDIIRLSLLIAKNIIKKEVEQSRDIVLGNITEAIGQLPDEDEIIIELNPKDYDFLMANKDLLSPIEGTKKVLFKKDDSVDLGGCLVKTRYSEVDARIDTQWREICQFIRGLGDGEVL